MRTDPPLLLPFACEELPPAVRHALRYAGVPCLDGRRHKPECRFLLANRTSDETEDEIAPARGTTACNRRFSHADRSRIIDVQSLMATGVEATCPSVRIESDKQHDQAFSALTHAELLLKALKATVEKFQGIWARLGDYPHAYRAALCEGSRDEIVQLTEMLKTGFVTRLAADQSPDSLRENRRPEGHETAYSDIGADEVPLTAIGDKNELHRAYLAGGLILRPRESKRRRQDDLKSSFAGDAMPLLWQTSCREFMQWWQIRERLQFSLARHPEGFSLKCTGVTGRWHPTIEVWKNQHVATLPWTAGERVWKSGQHVWLRERHKSPAGIFRVACWSVPVEALRDHVQLKQSA